MGGTVEYVETSGIIDESYRTRGMKPGEGDAPSLPKLYCLEIIYLDK